MQLRRQQTLHVGPALRAECLRIVGEIWRDTSSSEGLKLARDFIRSKPISQTQSDADPHFRHAQHIYG